MRGRTTVESLTRPDSSHASSFPNEVLSGRTTNFRDLNWEGVMWYLQFSMHICREYLASQWSIFYDGITLYLRNILYVC